ncbi:hypothetical protein BKA70DRAFT_1578665 [Coprinopsis sp. MPI-PUGE-AT-0042]|nr:hypothetical protein BKA70DRAFT_1578665 [Coprinopsis sp. MPI-PUGE-AT-0042]
MGKIQVDDRDTARIQYRGNWTPIGNSTRTLREVTEWGSTATFQFNGSYVGVFGSIPAGEGENIRVDFQVDNNPVVTTVRIADPDRSDDDVWFDAGPLDDKEHTLVIRYLGNDREFLFDYIEYEDTIITTSPNATSSSSSSGSSTASASPSPSLAVSASSTGVSPGALAGAVIGAVIGTAAIILLGLFLYNRRRRRRKAIRDMSREPPMSATSATSHIAPFDTGFAMDHANASSAQVKKPLPLAGASMFSGSSQSRHDYEGTVAASSHVLPPMDSNRFTLSTLNGNPSSPPAYGSEAGVISGDRHKY